MNKIISGAVKQVVVVIMISSELPGIIGVCDRIIVLHEGRITGEYNNYEVTQ